jgi:hypothetical protein
MKRRELLCGLGGLTLAGAAPDHQAAAGKDGGPADRFHLYLCAFHIAKKDPGFAVEAHHYCSPVNDEVHQCVIFDSTGEHARILGIEYIISDALYRKLPEAEKKYYHAHTYEILAGQLVAPKMEPDAELKLMGGLITTWGKTWHTWPDPATAVPLGEPLLMWSISKDGQLDERRLADRDRKLGINTAELRRRRRVLGRVPQIDPPKSINDLGRQWTNDGPDEPAR